MHAFKLNFESGHLTGPAKVSVNGYRILAKLNIAICVMSKLHYTYTIYMKYISYINIYYTFYYTFYLYVSHTLRYIYVYILHKINIIYSLSK